jgi:hypothetical protein
MSATATTVKNVLRLPAAGGTQAFGILDDALRIGLEVLPTRCGALVEQIEQHLTDLLLVR